MLTSTLVQFWLRSLRINKLPSCLFQPSNQSLKQEVDILKKELDKRDMVITKLEKECVSHILTVLMHRLLFNIHGYLNSATDSSKSQNPIDYDEQ